MHSIMISPDSSPVSLSKTVARHCHFPTARTQLTLKHQHEELRPLKYDAIQAPASLKKLSTCNFDVHVLQMQSLKIFLFPHALIDVRTTALNPQSLHVTPSHGFDDISIHKL